MRRRNALVVSILGALGVLLLLFFFRAQPLSFFFSFLERTLFAPVYESLARRSFIETTIENRLLRETLRDILGEEYQQKQEKSHADALAAMEEWATMREMPPPIIATPFSQYEERGQLLFLLNRGERDGVRKEATVILGRGIVVGRIVRTTQEASLLRLVTAKNQKFSARLGNAEETPGLLVGQGEEETLSMQFVPREQPSERGALVVTSGIDPHVPSGLLLGRVQETRTGESTPWKELVVTPLVRPIDLSRVGILQGE